MPLAPGTRLGHYEVVSLIGAGGMGEVYRARDTRLGRDAALKVLPEARLSDADRLDRFHREARVVASLNHPNIVTIFGVEEMGPALCLAMELVDGRPLSDLIPVGGVPPAKLMSLAIQLADAVSAAHERGIVHRDLKPANVMVTGDGRVKVLDFGLARLKEEAGSRSTTMPARAATAEGRILGTVAYMSPEQAEGRPVDHRSDIFSLGIVLFEMATGQRPFQGDSSLAVLSAILKDTPSSVTDLSPALPREFARLVRRCLTKDVEQRYQSAKDLRNDLEELKREIDSGAAVIAQQTPATQARPAGAARTRRWRLALPITIAGALVVASAVWWLLARHTSAPGTVATTGRAGATPASTRPKIAVALFDNRTGDALFGAFGAMVKDFVEAGLAQMPGVETALTAPPFVPGSEAVRSIAASTGDPVRTLAEQTGANTVVLGSYYLAADTLRVEAKIVDVTGKLLEAVGASGPRSDPMAVADQLRQRLLGAIASRMETAPANMLMPSRPTLYDAYRELDAGRELFGKGEHAQAIRHFERAAALDADFLLPQAFAVTAYRNLAQYEKAAAIIERLDAKRERMRPDERLWLDYGRADLEGRAADALARLRELEKMLPNDAVVKWLLGQRAMEMNRPGEALQAMQAPLEALRSPTISDPVKKALASTISPVYTSGIAYHVLARHDEELQLARQARAALPDDRAGRVRESRALAALGRLGELERLIAETIALPGAGEMPGAVMQEAVVELRAHGHGDAARALAEKAVRWHEALAPQAAKTPAARAARARALYQAGHWEEAQKLFASLAAESPDSLEYQRYLGTLAARLGNRARAAQLSQALGQVASKYLRGGPAYHRACIAAVLGDRDEAVSLLQRALAEGYRGTLNLHREMDFESLRDYPPFRELLKPKG